MAHWWPRCARARGSDADTSASPPVFEKPTTSDEVSRILRGGWLGSSDAAGGLVRWDVGITAGRSSAAGAPPWLKSWSKHGVELYRVCPRGSTACPYVPRHELIRKEGLRP